MDQLPVFLNMKGVRVLLVGTGAAADAKRRLIEAAGGVVVDTTDIVRVAFIALDDENEARRIADELRAKGLLVNVVDRPALSDFTVPAIIDRSPVIVAVGTGGASATLAKALRERLEALLPATLGSLAEALRQARPRVAARFPAAAERRRFWDGLLAPGGPLDPLANTAADTAITAAMQAPDTGGDARVEISVNSDDPDDLSLRQLRDLSRADVIVHDKDVPDRILDRARRDAVRIAAGGQDAGLRGLVVTIRWAGK